MDATVLALLADGNAIMAQRYMSAIGVAILLYDHACTFTLELELIWCWPTNPTRILFVVVRYGIAMAHILVGYALSGLAGPTSDTLFVISGLPTNCKFWIILISMMAFFGVLLSDFVLLVRVYALWDHRKTVLRTLTAGYIVMALCTVALTVPSVIDLARHAMFEGHVFHMCLITRRPKLWAAIWISQVAYYIFVLVLTLVNIAERPRRINVPLITDLRKDGLIFFVGMIVLRLASVVLGVLPNQALFLMTVWFTWSMATVTITRLILQVEVMVKQIHHRGTQGALVDVVMIEMEQHSRVEK
ncbi:hypothetical protein FA95DRAFT_1606276 [Auriscalpium vulgare]|uniref:Uncharacterized protein n=1 Tax=Auriscalpium vulgare TaxID=40419 RepID=A0ACB8RT16_9AGAM|nr:hypothetical protein FA95DRAFT_1606276 [Auriscalpium vulgare]